MILLLISVCFVLVSCKHDVQEESYEQHEFGNFTTVYSYSTYDEFDNDVNFRYMYDNDTKIMYCATIGSCYSMCPMYDKNGNIYTYENWRKDNFVK